MTENHRNHDHKYHHFVWECKDHVETFRVDGEVVQREEYDRLFEETEPAIERMPRPMWGGSVNVDGTCFERRREIRRKKGEEPGPYTWTSWA